MHDILVVGAGAVGCFYASRLAEGGAKVSLVCRSNYEPVSHTGVYMETHSFGNYTFHPEHVFPSVEKARGKRWNYVIVATKALSMDNKALQFLDPVISSHTTIVLIQNGVLVEKPFRERYERVPIISCVTMVSASLDAPNHCVQHCWTRMSIGPYTDFFAHVDNEEFHSLMEKAQCGVRELAQIFENGGIRDIDPCDGHMLQLARWHKVAINAAFNVTGVLAGGIGNATQVKDPLLRMHLYACMNEVFDAAPQIFGEPLPDKFSSPEKVIRANEHNTNGFPSMVLDWKAGRPMEIDVILGNPLLIASRHNVEMPRLQTMYALLHSAAREHHFNTRK